MVETHQAFQRSKVVQKDSKAPQMADLPAFGHAEPFWANLDPCGPFWTKNDFYRWTDFFCSEMV